MSYFAKVTGKNLHIRYRHTLDRLWSFPVFPLLRLSQDSGKVQQLSKPEFAVETRYLAAVLLALLILTALFVLYLLRAYDDNRLTSWQRRRRGSNPTRCRSGTIVPDLSVALVERVSQCAGQCFCLLLHNISDRLGDTIAGQAEQTGEAYGAA